MLVLSRKKGQEIHIGDNIVIVLMQIGNQTRLGIRAPRDVPIVRGELANSNLVEGDDNDD